MTVVVVVATSALTIGTAGAAFIVLEWLLLYGYNDRPPARRIFGAIATSIVLVAVAISMAVALWDAGMRI